MQPSKSLLAWLKLARLPAVFTALADICVGFLLTHSTWAPLEDFICLLAASAGLYLSGMVFNDVFDLQQDRAERPARPIPSGMIGLKPAIAFGTVLMLAGVCSAFFVGVHSLLVALLLAGAVFAYDGGLKRTPLGPLAMGTCRFLNILLGASAGAESLSAVWGLPQLWMAAAMGIYITGVTWFARTETHTSRRGSLWGGLVLLDLGLLMLLLWMIDLPQRWGIDLGPTGTDDALPMLLFWGVVTISLNRRAIGAIVDPVPASVQPAIGSMLMSIVTIDAMMIYFRLGPAGLPYTLGTLSLLLPAVLLRRWISMT